VRMTRSVGLEEVMVERAREEEVMTEIMEI
jgi:hypothetical protein